MSFNHLMKFGLVVFLLALGFAYCSAESCLDDALVVGRKGVVLVDVAPTRLSFGCGYHGDTVPP